MRVAWRDPQPLTRHDLAPYIEVIDRHIKEMCDQIQADNFKAALGLNREGFNHMTITANETQTVTLDTAEGTVLRLIDGDHTLAPAGALAVVDRSLNTDQSRFLPVAWLKGHEVNGMSQMDGGYDPETFVVNEFQVGDRVRVVNSAFEFGYEGVIDSIPATNGDDCIVAVDFPHTARMSYLFDRLEKVAAPDPLKEMRDALMRAFGQALQTEPEAETEQDYAVGDRVMVTYGHEHWDGPATVTDVHERIIIVETDAGRSGGFERNEVEPLEEDCCASYYEDDEPEDEPLAEWEKELLYGPRFSEGDVLVLNPTGTRAETHGQWAGLRVTVLRDLDSGTNVFVNPLEERPDEHGLSPFYWEREDFRPFEASDFQVGDIVEALRFGKNGEPAKAVVTRLEGEFGGDIEVNWTEGLDTLVAYGPIGARREHLTLVGTEKPDAEPVAEDFGFEAGQEIGSSDVLADLPMGTVVVVNGDEASPIVKLGSGSFGRLNRWNSNSNRTQPIAYFETETVERAADGNGTLVLAFVPGESA